MKKKRNILGYVACFLVGLSWQLFDLKEVLSIFLSNRNYSAEFIKVVTFALPIIVIFIILYIFFLRGKKKEG